MKGYRRGDPRAKANGHKGGTAGARTKRIRAMRRAAVKVGRPLTASEAALYRLAYANGYSAGQRTGEARGYRKGFAEALGERDEQGAS